MPCPLLFLSAPEQADEFLSKLARRADPSPETEKVEQAVRDIISAVRQKGLEAVVSYTRSFDAPDFTAKDFAVTPAELAAAAARVPAEDLEIIRTAADNIRAFHERQRSESWFTTSADGSITGQMVVPVERAGLYVPGGRGGATPLISSLLMTALPAIAAGVKEIAVVSPPMPNGRVNDHILAAAHLLGIQEVYAAGSAWAVAALACGAGTLKPVDVIAGPGNLYVATAKKILQGEVGIDMMAGPSEICIIAGQGANPAFAAADMLSQAEHDPLASSVCLCADKGFAEKLHAELERQLNELPRKDIAAAALRDYSAIICLPEVKDAVVLSNRLAPEHLELLLDDPWAVLPHIRHAGAVFMGHSSAEALGDYFAGPNHVLPTMGTARFSSALSTSFFCKKISIIAATPNFAAKHAEGIARLARLEGLEAHARSALCRKPEQHS